MKNIDDILEPLEIAISLEKKGKQMFLQAAKETKSKLARQTFEFLAAEEDKHIENIEKFYNGLKESEGEIIPEVEDSTAESRLEEFNKKLEAIKDEFKGTATDLEAYQMGLEFESGAEDFYAKKLAETENPKIQKIYRWLIVEESMHSRLINSCIKFVEDPASWFQSRSKA